VLNLSIYNPESVDSMGGKRRSNKKSKIFTNRATGLGGVLAGPWTATYFFYKSFRGVKQPKYAVRALLIGIPIPFIPVFWAYFTNLIDLSLRNAILLIYLSVFALVLRHYQPAIERSNKKLSGGYYSTLHAFTAAILIGLATLVVVGVSTVVLYKSTLPPYMSYEQISDTISGKYSISSIKEYDRVLKKVDSNDMTAVAKIDFLREYPNVSNQRVLDEIDALINYYKDNYNLATGITSLKKLPPEYSDYVGQMVAYSSFRVSQMETLKKLVLTGDQRYLDDLKQMDASIPTYENY